jgi:hypothetical protein
MKKSSIIERVAGLPRVAGIIAPLGACHMIAPSPERPEHNREPYHETDTCSRDPCFRRDDASVCSSVSFKSVELTNCDEGLVRMVIDMFDGYEDARNLSFGETVGIY